MDAIKRPLQKSSICTITHEWDWLSIADMVVEYKAGGLLKAVWLGLRYSKRI
ncbi:MAG TPA: hypothetical protein VE843_17500 [Ktedonobacteraceae bacterium]|nr:hypothetical protein [Ktedonobacteraceae bacterium]